jgi:hypothetical protein
MIFDIELLFDSRKLSKHSFNCATLSFPLWMRVLKFNHWSLKFIGTALLKRNRYSLDIVVSLDFI